MTLESHRAAPEHERETRHDIRQKIDETKEANLETGTTYKELDKHDAALRYFRLEGAVGQCHDFPVATCAEVYPRTR